MQVKITCDENGDTPGSTTRKRKFMKAFELTRHHRVVWYALIPLALYLSWQHAFDAQAVQAKTSPTVQVGGTARWRSTGGPLGGNVYALLSVGDQLFAATANGLFVATDGGRSWNRLQRGLAGEAVYTLAAQGGYLFATTDAGIYRSGDGGQNWAAAQTGLPPAAGLANFASQATTLYANLGGGIFGSSDQGESWTPMNDGLSRAYVYAVASLGDLLLAGTDKGVYRSFDGGQNWQSANNGLPRGVTSFAAREGKLYANVWPPFLTSASSSPQPSPLSGNVYVSNDQGGSWSPLNHGLNGAVVFRLFANETDVYAGTEQGVFRLEQASDGWTAVSNGLRGKSVSAFAVQGASLFVAASGDLYRSTNRGDEWTPLNTSIGFADARAYAVNGNDLYAATDDGVARLSLTDSNNWMRSNQGLTSGDVRALVASEANLFADTFGGGVFVSTDRAQTWRAVNSGLTDFQVQALAANNEWLYAGLEKQGVFRLSLRQANPVWQPANQGLTDKSITSLTVRGTWLIAGTSKGVFRSNDNGATWMPANNGLPLEQPQPFNFAITALVQQGDALFAQLSLLPTVIDGRVFGTLFGASLYRSTDNGESWSRVNPPRGRSFSSNPSSLAANGEWLFISTNPGQPIRDGASQPSPFSLYISNDQGEHWFLFPQLFGDNFQDFATSVFLTDKLVFASTNKRGVFVRERATLFCEYGLSTSEVEAKPEGESVEIKVDSDAICPWTAASEVDWITIASGATGSGEGTVKLTVAANPTTALREGKANLAEQFVTIKQPSCGGLAVEQEAPEPFEATGGTGRFGIQGHGTCGWTAVSQADWISITAGANGQGAGEVRYAVAANSGNQWRSATIRAAGQTYTIVQAGNGGTCTPVTITPGETVRGALTVSDCPQDLSALGSIFSTFSLTDRYAFNATAGQKVVIGVKAAFSAGIEMFDPAGRFSIGGGGTRLPQNGAYQIRTSGRHTISVSGDATALGAYELTVHLLDADCTYTLTPAQLQTAATGASGSLQLNTSANCRWQSYSAENWLKLTPSSGTGTTTINYTIPSNPATARATRALIAGIDLNVTQRAADRATLAITNLNPNYAVAGTPGLTLTVNGTGFTNGTKVRWNGQERPTTFVSNTQLTAALNANDLKYESSPNVTVSNAEPDFGQSAPHAFNVHPRNRQWVETSGPGGGQVTALLKHAGTLYAGTRQGALYRSSDQGRNWEQIFKYRSNDGRTLPTINDLMMRENILYVATQTKIETYDLENNFFPDFSPASFPSPVTALLAKGPYVFALADRLYRRGGDSFNWQPLTNGLPSANDALAQLIELDGKIYTLGFGNVLYVSADNGQQWRAINLSTSTPPIGISFFFIHKLFAANGTLYLGATDGVYRLTTDEKLARIGAENVGPVNVNLLGLSGTTLLAGSSFNLSGIGLPPASLGTTTLFRLNDDDSWVRSDEGLTDEHVTRFLPTDSGLFAAGFGAGILRSEDQGRTWRNSNRYLNASTVRALASLGNSLFAATTHGIYRTVDNGLNWTAAHTGLPELSVSALGSNGTALYAATRQGVYRSLDQGQSWKNTGLYGQAIRSFAFLGNQVFAAADGEAVAQELELITEPGNGVANFSPLAETSGVFSLGPTGGWKTAQRGMAGLPASALTVNGNNLWAGTFGGGVFLSTDGGQSWTARNAGLHGLKVYALLSQGTGLYVATDDGLYRSVNQGQNWQLITPLDFTKYVALLARGDTLFALSRNDGVFRSDDQGQNWTEVSDLRSDLFQQERERTLTVHGNFLVAGTMERSVIISDLEPGKLSIVSAASYLGNELANNSIASAFGSNLATTTLGATTVYPPYELAKTSVSRGSVFFVSPNQVNFLFSTTPLDENLTLPLTITSGDGYISRGNFTMVRVAPGLFSANGNGQGVAAAYAVRVRPGGAQSYEPVARFDAAQNKFVAAPLDLGPDHEQVFLVLYGTGLRYRLALSMVRVSIGGLSMPVEFAGAQGELPGLDQINVRLPRTLIGRGEVEVVVTVEGKPANAVRVHFR